MMHVPMHAYCNDRELGVDGNSHSPSRFFVVVLVCVWVVGTYHPSFLYPFWWFDVMYACALPKWPCL